jgi:DNA ligase (NAD+)
VLFRSLGFKLSNEQISNNLLDGLNLVITGTFDEVKRDKVIEQLSELGAKFSSKVTKQTHLLICGKNAGSKFKDAMLNEVPIIQEVQLLNLLANPQNFNQWKK